jgi:hypothetical protein
MSESRLPIHPYAEIFPPMQFPAFDALCGDIARHGLQEDIVLYEGQVLEGRNRYVACLARGDLPRFREYAGECGSPVAFVVARNIHRRHLTDSQRALLAARLKPLFEEEARQRQLAGLKKGDAGPVGTNSSQREDDASTGRSATRAAEVVHVSSTSVKLADKVKKQGVPELVAALAADQISVSAAARIARLPAEQQHEIIAAIRRGLKPKEALARLQAVPPAPSPMSDDNGQPVPEPARAAFAQRDELRALCRQLDSACQEVTRLGQSAVGRYLDSNRGQQHLRSARENLWTAQPAVVCSHYQGPNSHCTTCGDSGWITAAMRPQPKADPAPVSS